MSDADLFAELARRRLARGQVDLEAIETHAEQMGRTAGEEIQAATIASFRSA